MRDTGDKRRQILAAAVEIFADRGFYRAKIADIAAAAGVGKGTVYEYFRSKKDLFQQLLLHIVTTYLDHLEEIVCQEQDLRQFLQRVVTASLDYFRDHPEIARILLRDHPPVDAATHQLLFAARQEKLNRLTAYLQGAVERGEMRPVTPVLVAAMLIGSIAELGYQAAYGRMVLDLRSVAGEIVTILLQGIGRPEGASDIK